MMRHAVMVEEFIAANAQPSEKVKRPKKRGAAK